jgi:hypothetical protein
LCEPHVRPHRSCAGVGAGYHFLAGDLSDGVAAFSDRRIRVDHYRGAPPAAAEATRAIVASQIDAKRAREAAEREEERRAAEEAAR